MTRHSVLSCITLALGAGIRFLRHIFCGRDAAAAGRCSCLSDSQHDDLRREGGRGQLNHESNTQTRWWAAHRLQCDCSGPQLP